MKQALLIAAGIIAFVVLAVPLLFARPSNCGGNSAALSAVNNAVLSMWLVAGDNDGRFSIERLNPDERRELAKCGRNRWISSARILALREPIQMGLSNEVVVVVCDTAYDNVPQPAMWNLWQRNPTHAVAYANGKCVLLSRAEFGQLNLAAFVDLAALSASTNR